MDYTPQSPAARLYASFFDWLKTSPGLAGGFFIDNAGNQTVNDLWYAERGFAIETDCNSPGNSGWLTECSHSFVMQISVAVWVKGYNALKCLDIGQAVIDCVFPGDDQDARDRLNRLKSTIPASITIVRAPVFFERVETPNNGIWTKTEAVFAFELHQFTGGQI